MSKKRKSKRQKRKARERLAREAGNGKDKFASTLKPTPLAEWAGRFPYKIPPAIKTQADPQTRFTPIGPSKRTRARRAARKGRRPSHVFKAERTIEHRYPDSPAR